VRQTDIAIVGGGLAGAAAGAMLGRARIASLVIDPHRVYPPDFRCEKLDGDQLLLLRKTGLYDAVRAASTHNEEVSIVRYGRIADRKPLDQFGFPYGTLVNAVRNEIRAPGEFVHAKVAALSVSDDRQMITLASGEIISARLIVLATGLGVNLRKSLGMERIELSKGHSVSIGFDMVLKGPRKFDFKALTYYPEDTSHGVAYLALFPVGDVIRANFFVYRDVRDPWLQRLRTAPEDAVAEALPRLKNLTGAFAVKGPVDIRPVDLYKVDGYKRGGAVLVGDAFCTSCPAAGTGAGKALTDVERLCNVHIPNWLATPGMGAEKITAFYDDPVKRASDDSSREAAFFLRALSTETSVLWRALRLMRSAAQSGRGMVRAIREPGRFVQSSLGHGTKKLGVP
jgi:2-polyprenyl-6-methoxyphenol hydroxylase-like FAD-dependent oxidoreductase